MRPSAFRIDWRDRGKSRRLLASIFSGTTAFGYNPAIAGRAGFNLRVVIVASRCCRADFKRTPIKYFCAPMLLI
jgi:hypothetical protein